eukprot:scaffold153_cov347-Pavlova_lutheri.AAC.48
MYLVPQRINGIEARTVRGAASVVLGALLAERCSRMTFWGTGGNQGRSPRSSSSGEREGPSPVRQVTVGKGVHFPIGCERRDSSTLKTMLNRGTASPRELEHRMSRLHEGHVSVLLSRNFLDKSWLQCSKPSTRCTFQGASTYVQYLRTLFTIHHVAMHALCQRDLH